MCEKLIYIWIAIPVRQLIVTMHMLIGGFTSALIRESSVGFELTSFWFWYSDFLVQAVSV